LLNHEEESALVERSKKRQMFARNRIVNGGLQLAAAMADHYAQQGVDRADLVSEGMRRFFCCLERFDPTQKASFFRYAAWWMKFGMSELIKCKTAYCLN
jgi:DNA-directed RNA polymerase sigma subunit (sigma70/sigma32)